MMTSISVRKSITVDCAQAHAFDIFVHRQSEWWERDKCLGEAPLQQAIAEPYAGGRWYEIDSKGAECSWGKVVVYEPPRRVVFAWQISAGWKYDPSIYTELEVRFIPEGDKRTRVELEHRGLEAYGEHTEKVRALFDAGWQGLLQAFARRSI